MQDILRAIVELEKVQYGILRISAPEDNIQGRIVFADDGHIVDASITGQAENYSSYECLRQLLSLNRGNCVFLDSGTNRPAEFTDSLYIHATRILALLPNLPVNPSELFDEKSLLDKVFGSDRSAISSDRNKDKDRHFTFEPTQVEATPVSPSNSQRWELVEPLFNNPACSPYLIPDQAQTEAEAHDQQRQSMTRLRALPMHPNPSIFNILKQRASVLFSVMLVFAAAMTALINPRFIAGISQLTANASVTPLKQALRTSSQ